MYNLTIIYTEPFLFEKISLFMCLCSHLNVSVILFHIMLFFVFLLFLGMVMYANEVETKEKLKLPDIKT